MFKALLVFALNLSPADLHVGLQVADAVSTIHLVNRGGFEMNPIVRPMLGHPAPFVALKIAIGTSAKRLPERDVKLLNWFYLAVVANNFYQIGRLR